MIEQSTCSAFRFANAHAKRPEDSLCGRKVTHYVMGGNTPQDVDGVCFAHAREARQEGWLMFSAKRWTSMSEDQLFDALIEHADKVLAKKSAA